MSDIENKKKALISAYPGENWKHKVLSMRDAQVVALYMKFKKEGKIK